ncbi:MAG: hypothetical protein RLN76_05475 [Phycisphaeraceae bacterium]
MNHNRYGMAMVYLVAALALGAIGAGMFINQVLQAQAAVKEMLEEFVRIEIPGSAEITIDRPGLWTIYIEHPPTQVRETRVRPESLVCSVRNQTTGEPIAISDLLAGEPTVDPSLFAKQLADPEETTPDVYVYELPDRAGHGSWQFRVQEPTTVLISATLDDAEPMVRDLNLAVGTGSFRELLSGWSGLYGAAAILTITMTGATMLLVIGYMRTTRDVTPRSEMPKPPAETA